MSAAVGAPLALKSSSKSEMKWEEAKNSLDLKGCTSENYDVVEKVNYGDASVKNICGAIEDQGEPGMLSANVSENFTDVLKETWIDANQSGKGPTFGRWMQQCLGSEMPSQGAILLNSDSDTQHLGECGASGLHQTKFIKKMKDPSTKGNTENGLIGLCERNCGDNDINSIGRNTEVLQEEKSDQGKKIQFYRKRSV